MFPSCNMLTKNALIFWECPCVSLLEPRVYLWCVMHRHLEQEVVKEANLIGKEPKIAEDLKEIIQFQDFSL